MKQNVKERIGFVAMTTNRHYLLILSLALFTIVRVDAQPVLTEETGDSQVVEQETQGLLSKDNPLPVNARILSVLELAKTDPDAARPILAKIVAISENFNVAEQYLMLMVKAMLADKTSEHQQIIDWLTEALAMEEKIAKQQLFSPDFSQIHLILAERYADNQEYELAFEQKKRYLDKYSDYRKDLRKQRLAKLNEKYETDLKLKQNELLKSQHELKALQLKEAESQTQSQRRNIVILIVTAIIFLLLLIRQFRIRTILRSLSKTDILTGLYNRRTLFEQGEKLLQAAINQGSNLSAIMIDIDHFKQVNDTKGHDVGDKVISLVASLGRETVRPRDVFARLGGEEFAIILPSTSLDEAKAIAERFREKVEQTCLKGEDVNVTISAGVADYSHVIGNLDDVLHAADEAMYLAKSLGRNQVCCYQQQQI